MNFFSSDHHFFHHNIIGYCDRPFKNVDEMNKELIMRHNRVVSHSDTLYLLGDLTMLGPKAFIKLQEILAKMNGQKILILGNHDVMKPHQYLDMGFSQIIAPYFDYKASNGDTWHLFHDPSLKTVFTDDNICLCGHVHNLFESVPGQKLLNVGVDIWDYYPISETAIFNLIGAWS